MATSTAGFGAGKRENHDSSASYARPMSDHTPWREATALVADAPAEVLDRIFTQSAESMRRLAAAAG